MNFLGYYCSNELVDAKLKSSTKASIQVFNVNKKNPTWRRVLLVILIASFISRTLDVCKRNTIRTLLYM